MSDLIYSRPSKGEGTVGLVLGVVGGRIETMNNEGKKVLGFHHPSCVVIFLGGNKILDGLISCSGEIRPDIWEANIVHTLD